MDYKVLVKIYIPEIEKSYELYLPINKTISQIKILINKLINNITGEIYPIKNINLYNRKTAETYNDELILRNTNIRNGTELVIG